MGDNKENVSLSFLNLAMLKKFRMTLPIFWLEWYRLRVILRDYAYGLIISRNSKCRSIIVEGKEKKKERARRNRIQLIKA